MNVTEIAVAIGCVLPIVPSSADGRLVIAPSPLATVPGLTNVIQVASGAQHIVGVQPDGTLAFWVSSTYSAQSGYKPLPSGLSNVIQVSALWHHGLALCGDGKVHSWGDPGNGGTDVPPGLSNVVAVAAGTSAGHALLPNGRVLGWGDNSYNQRTSPDSLTNAIAIAAGYGWCAALGSNRVISVWGNNAPSVVTANSASNIVAIASGYNRLLALRDDGTVWSSADDVPTGLTNVIAISAGYQRSLALTGDRVLIQWPAGEAIVGVSNVVSLGGGFTALAVADVRPIFQLQPIGGTNYAGSTATLATAVAGTAPISVQWLRDGLPIPGETNLVMVLTNLGLTATAVYSMVASNVIGMTASSNAFIAVMDGRPVISRQPSFQRAFTGQTVQLAVEAVGSLPLSFQWRFNGGNIPNTSGAMLRIPSIEPQQEGVYSVEVTNSYGATESSNAIVLVRPLAMWGTFPVPRTDPPLDLTNGLAIASSVAHFLALNGEGRLFTWGHTNTGTTSLPSTPTDVVWISGASGAPGNLVLTADGSVYGWGGFQSFVPPATPAILVATALGGGVNYALTSAGQVIQWGPSVTTLPWSNIVQISAGINHIIGLQHDGLVVVSGFNLHGQLVIPGGLSNVVAVAAGRLFSMALRRDGTVVAWGDNRYGQCNVPPSLSDVVAITGGDYTAYALKADGTVNAWGRNDFGQTVVPEGLSNVIAIAAGQNQAAALIGPPELRNRRGPTMNNPAANSSSFCVEVLTPRARTIILEASQDGLTWTMIRAVAGNGLDQKICDPSATSRFKLYRARAQ